MFCTQCGVQMDDNARFCSQCGFRAAGAEESARDAVRNPKRLRRSLFDKKLGGVCSGLADYLDVDVVLVRILVVAGTIVSGGLGLLIYLAAWMIVPLEREPMAHAGDAPLRTSS